MLVVRMMDSSELRTDLRLRCRRPSSALLLARAGCEGYTSIR